MSPLSFSKGGYASTAIAPIEVFHSAGVVWNWLHGENLRPRFRVRTASVDGRKVSAAGSLGLTPDCSISDLIQTDIIIVSAPGWDVLDHIVEIHHSCRGCESGMRAGPTLPAHAA